MYLFAIFTVFLAILFFTIQRLLYITSFNIQTNCLIYFQEGKILSHISLSLHEWTASFGSHVFTLQGK